jgi:hypothetical protein
VQIRPYPISLAFTGVFGLLFAKTYRVFKIFTSMQGRSIIARVLVQPLSHRAVPLFCQS